MGRYPFIGCRNSIIDQYAVEPLGLSAEAPCRSKELEKEILSGYACCQSC